MPGLVNWLDGILYSGYADNWDDELFRGEILNVLNQNSCVLDLGAGAGLVLQMNFRGLARRVCGVDPDGRVVGNPQLDEAQVADGESIPYPDSTFDVIFADNVLEHLEHPTPVFQEVVRTLKPGGTLLVKTPNKWHYVATIARWTPHWFHEFTNRMRGRCWEDTFPTRYRANTPAALQKFAAQSGLKIQQIHLVEGRPEYMRLSWPLYLLGWAYERFVNLVPGMSRLRVVLIAVMYKPSSVEEAQSSMKVAV